MHVIIKVDNVLIIVQIELCRICSFTQKLNTFFSVSYQFVIPFFIGFYRYISGQ